MQQGLIRDVIEDLVCPKGFLCCTEGLEKLCKAKDVGMRTFVQCLEPNPIECPFSKLLAVSYVCKCPLRIYITKELNK
ncbi:MAG: hypothetical protein ABUK19_05985 [Desulfobacteria bacterium]|jgi:hypothetical protein